MGFSSQEYWSGLPCPPPRDIPDPGIEPTSLCLLHWQVGSFPLAPPGKVGGRHQTALVLPKLWPPDPVWTPSAVLMEHTPAPQLA